MPILERDPWRLQYFEATSCPEEVTIPTDDPDCWMLYPEHCWIYDKLRIATSQGIACGPHGVMPEIYPVFSKPIINLKGMGVDSVAIMNEADMNHHYRPGNMWMTLLEGDHVSTDCAIVDGKIHWQRHAVGLSTNGGTFLHWTIAAAPRPELELYLSTWVARHMRSYSGMMNFETIGGQIIECHLRFADQWCDLYGPGWIEALVCLYTHKIWDFDDSQRCDGFSIPLFGRHGFNFSHPPAAILAEIRSLKAVSSLQITFYETRQSTDHPMPPGGFRLAVINASNLEDGLNARDRLALSFPPEQLLDLD